MAHAKRHYPCGDRPAEFIDKLSNNLDTLSGLAGFDPTSTTDNWHALPTHTLRFAEVLEKICASQFRIGEILYLFDADDSSGSQDIFPLQEQSEAIDQPLGLPDDEHEFSLWHLRRELLDAEHRDIDTDEWHWQRIEAVLQDEFGFNSTDILALGRHFFPHTLQRAGYQVDSASMRFVSNLPVAQTTPANWTTPAGPFQYDPVTAGGQLWTQIPCPDSAVVTQLTGMPALNGGTQRTERRSRPLLPAEGHAGVVRRALPGFRRRGKPFDRGARGKRPLELFPATRCLVPPRARSSHAIFVATSPP